MELARPGHASGTEGYSLSNEVWPCGSAGKVPATKLTTCLIPGTHMLEAEEQFTHIVLLPPGMRVYVLVHKDKIS